MRMVWVELDQTRNFVVRIFRSAAASCGSDGPTDLLPYAQAVSALRHAIVIRGQGFCELCGSPITSKTGHMHELKPRGKGGEISLENSVFICSTCHRRAHAARNPRFFKKRVII